MSENSVENEVVRRRPRWLVPLVAGVCVVALAGGVTGGVIAWRDGNARALADAQSRCECSLAKVDEARKAHAKMVESAGGMKAVKAEQVADALAARRSSPTCSPAGSPAGRAPPPWTPGAAAAGAGTGDIMGRLAWRRGRSRAPFRPWRAAHRPRVRHRGRGMRHASPDRHGRRPVRQRHGRGRRRRVQDRARPAAQALPGSEGPGTGDVPAGLAAGTRSVRTSPRAAGHRNGPNRVLREPNGASRPTIRVEQKNRPYHPVSLLQRLRRSLRVLVQATEEPQRTSSLQKLMAHWMTDTLAFSQTVPMGRTATRALNLAKKPRRQHVKL